MFDFNFFNYYAFVSIRLIIFIPLDEIIARNILLQKLYKYEIQENVLKWFNNYLENRKQVVQ